MFSGIVQEIGTVKALEEKQGLLEITISHSKQNVQIGDSVAIDGCCQTVVWKSDSTFTVQAAEETLKKTNFHLFQEGTKVNLEPALKVGSSLDGHLVSGHIDTCGKVVEILKNNENQIIKISFPKELNKFISSKGSISINGVSLTVIDVKQSIFSFTLIPFTRDNTNLGLIKIDDLVNLEVDLVSRYLVNYLESNKIGITN